MPEAQEGHQSHPSASAWQLLRRFAEMLLLLWAFIKFWIDMVKNGIIVCQQFPDPDPKFVAPLVVLVVGLLMTGLLGFQDFWQQGRHGEAIIAAVDLDTPYLAWKHGRQVIYGEDCPDWEKLRLRNSTWRSLPLAMMTFALAFRVLMEIPMCQTVLFTSIMAIGTFPQLTNHSLFAQDLRRDGLEPSQIGRVRLISDLTAVVPDYLKETSGLDIAWQALDVEKQIWVAAHCRDSRWQQKTLPRSQDDTQTWAMASLGHGNLHGELGGVGSGNLLAFNSMQNQRIKKMLQQNEEVLRPAAIKLAKRAKSSGLKQRVTSFGRHMAARFLPWNELVDLAYSSYSGRNASLPELTVQQSRPWKSKMGPVELVLQDGWKLSLCQTCALLLTAFFPILKKTLETCHIRDAKFKGLVAFHAILDIACLVATWLLCAAAPAAYYFGHLIESLTSQMWPLLREVLEGMSDISQEQLNTNVARMLAKFIHQAAPACFSIMLTNLLPALQWSLLFLLRLAAGSLVFLGLSSLLARGLCPHVRLANCLQVGICGPLWLFADCGEIETTARRICFMMTFRSLLFTLIVAFEWRSVDFDSRQVFFGTICNLFVEVNAVERCWLAACFAHCISGLISVACAYQSLAKCCDEVADDRTPYSMSFGPHGSYGSFQPYECNQAQP